MSTLTPRQEVSAAIANLGRNPIDTIRGKQVLLDFNAASLYGVPTKRLNEAVKRNQDRFPSDFCFTLSPDEWEGLKQPVANCDQSPKIKHLSGRPYAFTREGVAQLSTVLRSERAVEVNLAIMRYFVQSASGTPPMETVEPQPIPLPTAESPYPSTMEEMKLIANALQILMKRRHYTYADVERYSGVGRSTVSDVCSQRNNGAWPQTRDRLRAFLEKNGVQLQETIPVPTIKPRLPEGLVFTEPMFPQAYPDSPVNVNLGIAPLSEMEKMFMTILELATRRLVNLPRNVFVKEELMTPLGFGYHVGLAYAVLATRGKYLPADDALIFSLMNHITQYMAVIDYNKV